jgi:polar amino acid transport system substrate-binding protein
MSGSTTPTPSSTTMESTFASPTDLVAPQVLTVGSYLHYVPQEFYDTATHQAVGFDIDLIKAIGQRLGLRVVIIDADFQQLMNQLAGRRFDVAISAISIVPELQQKASFVSYFHGGESLLVQKGNPSKIQAMTQLCGQKVAVQEKTFEQNDLADASKICQQSGKAAITVVTRPKLDESIQLLASRTVVASYQSAAQSDYWVLQHPALFEVGGAMSDQNTQGIAVRKNDPSMLHAVQTAFQSLVEDGTYQEIIKRWGLVSGDITRPSS